MFNNIIRMSQSSDNIEKNGIIDNLSKIDYNTFYRGYVIDNNDPLKLGRIKVRIPQIYGFDENSSNYVSSISIPWATPAILQASGNDCGSYIIPDVGSMVFVTFEFKEASKPIYFGGIFYKTDGTEKEIASYNVNNNKSFSSTDDDLIKEVSSGTERVIYKSLKGATIYVDDADGKESLKIIDQSGQEISLIHDGSSLSRRGNKLGITSDSKIIIDNHRGDYIKMSEGEIVIKTKSLKIQTDNVDRASIDRDLSAEAALVDTINGEKVVDYNHSTDSSLSNYHEIINNIIGDE